jgi:cytochrome P450
VSDSDLSESDRAASDDLSFNAFDPSQTQHMWGLMERLRSECPVSRPMEGFVYTATYADTASTFKDAKRFSSAEGFRGAGVVVPEEESFLGEIDPPLHPRVRRLLHRAFTPRTAAEVEPFTRGLTEELIEPIITAGGGDIMAGLCTVLPVAVSAEALGIPREQHAEVAHWCQELLHSTWPETNATERGVGVGGGFPEFAEIIDAQIRLRRTAADPPDDLLTRMVQAEDKGDRLTDLHIRTLAVNTLAGSLSTTYMLGNLLYRFVSDPSFAETLRANRELIPEAVEESLRLEPPVLFLFRTVKEETTIGDTPVHAGERVILGMASGNRDEQAYECPAEFRLDRGITKGDAPDHLTFGVGPHICLGIHVARMEGRVVLEAMLDRFAPDQVTLADDYELNFVPMFLEYGPETLTVRVAS